MTGFMDFKTSADYSISYLNAIYNTWSTLTLQPTVTANFGNIEYTSSGSAGKAILQGAPNNWTVTDGGITSGISTLGTTGTNPTAIVLDSLGNIYTANNGSANVSKITPSGVSTIFATVGTNPFLMLIDSSDNLYVSVDSSSTIQKITSLGVVTPFSTTGTSPIQMVFDSLGNIFVANLLSNDISKITTTGVSTIFASLSNAPLGLTIDSSDNLYASLNVGVITKITPSGVTSTFISGVAQGNLACDSLDNIYILGGSSNTLQKISSSGIIISSASTISTPRRIIVDSSDNVYYTNTTSVRKVTSVGVTTTFPVTLSNPTPLVIDSTDTLYIANFGTSDVTKIIQ
jgi:hypothetical protein